MKRAVITILIGLFISCNPSVDHIIPNEVDQFALQFIKDIQEYKIDQCLTKVADDMNNEQGKTFISKVASKISILNLDSLSIINGSSRTLLGDNPETTYIVEYEQEIDNQSIYFFFNILKVGKTITVKGFDARWISTPLREVHAFTFNGKSMAHYIFFILSIASLSFIIFTLIAIIKTPLKRKWLWIIAVLFAIAKFKLNWTTGDFDFRLLHFQLLGAGFHKSGLVAPWFLSFSIPVFAIAFWIKKYQKDKEKAETERVSKLISKYSQKDNNESA
jgi:hypothetical protein